MNEVVTPYPPTPFQSLMFYGNDPVWMSREVTGGFEKQPVSVLVGPQHSRVNVKVSGQLNAIRVDFAPGGMFRMLGIPMVELFDGGFDAVEFFGAQIKEVNERLSEITEPAQGKTIVEKFLLQRSGKLKCRLPVDTALRLMLIQDGREDIEQAASLSCLSLKQFERKCRERVGMNPKTFARILRFSKAYRMHEAFPELSWTSIAHEAGYYDQMHMIRDFKIFAGVTPTVIEKQLLSTPLRMQRDLQY